jgi:putative ABC transport system permease protein
MMRRLRTFAAKVRAQFRQRSADRQFDEELQTHLQLLTERFVSRGMSSMDAECAARRQLGNVALLQQRQREARTFLSPSALWFDVRYGLRMLRKSPGFSAVAVLILALGIGASTSVFSLIDAVLIRALPYPDPERLVYLWSPNPRFQVPIQDLPPLTADFYTIRSENRSFSNVALFTSARFNVSESDRADVLGGARVTGEFFKTLQVPTVIGRSIDSADDQPGHARVAVISHQLWQSRFGKDPAVLGKVLTINAQTYTILGVMPAGFAFPRSEDPGGAPAESTDVWIPWAMTQEQRANWNDSAGIVIGRLRSGVTIQQAQAEMGGIIARLDRLRPAMGQGFGALVMPFASALPIGSRNALLLAMGAVTLVLLIACTNVASLLMARGAGRIHEMGVRIALGARRSRLLSQLLTESLVLATCGGAFGCCLAFASLRLLLQLDPGNIPRLDEASIDPVVLLFATGLSMVTGLMCGLFPALFASRCSPSIALTHFAGRSIKGTRSRFRSSLIVAQTALTVLLLAGSGLLIRSLLGVYSVDKGFQTRSIVTMHLSLDERYNQSEGQVRFYRELLGRVNALPGVRSAGTVTSRILGHDESLTWVSVEGHPFQEKTNFQTNSAAPLYFETMGIRLLHGRLFTDEDAAGRPLVAIVNSTFAKVYFLDQDAVGKRFHFIDGRPAPTWWTIVGVVADVRQLSLEEMPGLQIYLPLWQTGSTDASLAVRADATPDSLVSAVRKTVHAMDPSLAVGDVATMESLVSEATAGRRFQALLSTLFAGAALLLAVVGLYALVASAVQQRSAEFGIRMALGARRWQVLLLVLGDGMKLALIGVALGLAASLALSRIAASFLYGVTPTDPVTFSGAALLLIITAFSACYIPARRATHVDPAIALRCE